MVKVSESPIASIVDEGRTPLEDIAEANDIYSLTADPEDPILKSVQLSLVRALETIGPHTMDDSAKYAIVRHTIAAMVTVEADTTLDTPTTLEGIESAGRGPHYHPIAEVDQLEEPTVEALGERYSVADLLEDVADEPRPYQVQHQIALALLELNGARFPAAYTTGQCLLAAMVLADMAFDSTTELKVESVTDTYRSLVTEGDDEGELIEYETEAITIWVTAPTESHDDAE